MFSTSIQLVLLLSFLENKDRTPPFSPLNYVLQNQGV